MNKYLLISLAAILSGCMKKPVEVPEKTAKPSPPTIFTPKEWQNTFRSTFKTEKRITDDDGITRYGACFESDANGKCLNLAGGKNDSFRKIDHLTPLGTDVLSYSNLMSYVGIYIAAPECEAASIMIAPSVNKEGDWLFLEKISFMADGDVVLEYKFDHNDINRSNKGRWIHENGVFIASEADVRGLEKFSSAKNKIIRLTGDNGYITIEKASVAVFAEATVDVLKIRRRLIDAFSAAGGPNCTNGKQPTLPQ